MGYGGAEYEIDVLRRLAGNTRLFFELLKDKNKARRDDTMKLAAQEIARDLGNLGYKEFLRFADNKETEDDSNSSTD